MKRTKAKTTLVKSMIVMFLAFALGVSGACSLVARLKTKEQPFKNAVYLSTVAVGLNALTEAVGILERANKLNTAEAKGSKKVLRTASLAYQEADRLFNKGDFKGAADKVKEVAASLRSLQDQGAFFIVDAQSQAWAYLLIDLGRTAAQAFSNSVTTGSPNVTPTREALVKVQEANGIRVRGNAPVYILELTSLVVRAQAEVQELVLKNTPEEVRAAGAAIIVTLIEKLSRDLGVPVPTPTPTPVPAGTAIPLKKNV